MSHPVWVRGLKQSRESSGIERSRSHPVWVRGLKPVGGQSPDIQRTSHPVWVRGLKPQLRPMTLNCLMVAPRVGAWIETHLLLKVPYSQGVAPRVGAWIETVLLPRVALSRSVAPRVGAWIETLLANFFTPVGTCRTPCGCVD